MTVSIDPANCAPAPIPVSLLRYLADEEAQAERERLARHICEWIRVTCPRLPFDDYLVFRDRVRKTSLHVLREIFESDTLHEAAAAILPAGLGAR